MSMFKVAAVAVAPDDAVANGQVHRAAVGIDATRLRGGCGARVIAGDGAVDDGRRSHAGEIHATRVIDRCAARIS